MTEGTFVLPNEEDLLGRYFRRGELVGYVVDFPLGTVRVVVEQDSIGLIRENIEAISIRFSSRPEKEYPVQLKKIVPAASKQLINKALGKSGGGEIALDMNDSSGTKTYEAVFNIELLLDESLLASRVGERVYVLFDHGTEALIFQWFRMFRNLFLSHFDV
jgi:putative peptide zinc metalloprotease protein